MKSSTYENMGVNHLTRTLRPSSVVEVGRFEDRVKEIIRLCGGVPELARSSGLSDAVLRKWQSGQSDPSRSNLLILANAAGVRIEWLAAGIGPMKSDSLPNINEFLDELASDAELEYHQGTEGDYSVIFPEDTVHKIADFVQQYSKTHTSEIRDEYAYIPLYNVEASAGHGSYVETEEVASRLAFRRDWINKEIHANPSNLHLIYVRGDSMEPALESGQVVMVDTSAAHEAMRDGIYVIQIDGSVLIKRLQRLPGNKIKVMSDNQIYPSFEADLNSGDITIIGRVIWHAGRI